MLNGLIKNILLYKYILLYIVSYFPETHTPSKNKERLN